MEKQLNLPDDSLNLCSLKCEEKNTLRLCYQIKLRGLQKHASGFKMPFHTNSLAYTHTSSAWQERIR